MMTGSEVRARREKLGLTQKALSKMAGMAQSQLCKIEKGAHVMRAETEDRLARALHRPGAKAPRATKAKSVRRGRVSNGVKPSSDPGVKVLSMLVGDPGVVRALYRLAVAGKV